MSVRKRNNVNVLGSGKRTLLFAHGYGCDQSMWRHITPSFPDYKIVLFDYVGSGNSDASAFNQTRYSTLKGYAADVLEIIDEFSLEGVNFVGHSVSSMIGALAVIESPAKFESLTMIGPSPCYINDREYIGGFERADIAALLESLESNHVAWSASMAPAIMGQENSPIFLANWRRVFVAWIRFWLTISPESHFSPTIGPTFPSCLPERSFYSARKM
jgi:sigma-B regulation protein RsbQ